jgi:hypothetical protein
MLRMIMEGNYSFSSPEWDDISENTKDLVSWYFIFQIHKLTANKWNLKIRSAIC